jgi:hypothetical protein
MEEILFLPFFFDAPLGRNKEGQTVEDTDTLSLAIIVGGGAETMDQ